MKAKMSNRWARAKHIAALLRTYIASECEHGALSLAAEREARAILAETEPLNTPRTTYQTARFDRHASAGHQSAMVALAEALAAFVGE